MREIEKQRAQNKDSCKYIFVFVLKKKKGKKVHNVLKINCAIMAIFRRSIQMASLVPVARRGRPRPVGAGRHEQGATTLSVCPSVRHNAPHAARHPPRPPPLAAATAHPVRLGFGGERKTRHSNTDICISWAAWKPKSVCVMEGEHALAALFF